jgi:hypothetical protein
MPRIKHPEEKIFEYARNMSEDPEQYGKKIAELARQEGYPFIKDCLCALDSLAECEDNKKLYQTVTLLRKPEWVWKHSAENKNLYFFGTKDEEDTFQVRGYLDTPEDSTEPMYSLYPNAEVDLDDEKLKEGYVVSPEVVRDTKLKCYKISGRYYIVEAGRIIDLLARGYDLSKVVLTKGKGYLKRFQGYVQRTDSHDSSSKAWEHFRKETTGS